MRLTNPFHLTTVPLPAFRSWSPMSTSVPHANTPIVPVTEDFSSHPENIMFSYASASFGTCFFSALTPVTLLSLGRSDLPLQTELAPTPNQGQSFTPFFPVSPAVAHYMQVGFPRSSSQARKLLFPSRWSSCAVFWYCLGLSLSLWLSVMLFIFF